MEQGKLHHGLTYDNYASLSTTKLALRASGLKLMKKSPRHFKLNLQKEETPALRRGKIVHSLFENQEKFRENMIIEPEFTGKTKDGRDSARSKEAKDAKADWYASIPGDKIVVTMDEVDMIDGISRSLKEKKMVRNILDGGIAETSLWVEDKDNGATLACRPDFISRHGHVIDLKTCRDAGPSSFLSQVFRDTFQNPFYILQAAHYAHCLRLAGIGSGESFTFIAIEDKTWDFMVYPMDIGCLGPGEQWRSLLTDRYAECLKADVWPGYDDRAYPVTVPQYVEVPGEED